LSHGVSRLLTTRRFASTKARPVGSLPTGDVVRANASSMAARRPVSLLDVESHVLLGRNQAAAPAYFTLFALA
jgi:hypothetical protein